MDNKKNKSLIINIITYFPKFYRSFFNTSIIGKLVKQRKVIIRFKKLFLFRVKNKIDDKIFGGGPGLLLRPDVAQNAFNSIKTKGFKIVLSPRGEIINVNLIQKLLSNNVFTILCPRFEGVDQRFINFNNFKELSIGNFVLFDGDSANIILINLLIRYLFLKKESFINDSFSFVDSKIEYDNFTRPYTWNGISVPDVLIRGNHKLIDNWKNNNLLDNNVSIYTTDDKL